MRFIIFDTVRSQLRPTIVSLNRLWQLQFGEIDLYFTIRPDHVVQPLEQASNGSGAQHIVTKRHSDIDASNCSESTIMSNLIQNASPFLFPCTIEYSLICAVIVYEMWKNIKSIPNIERQRRTSIKPNASQRQSAHHFSVDCSRAHRGMFAGILIIVLTIICLIMYFVLRDEPDYERTAIREVVYCEILM